MRILIAEDDLVSRKFMLKLLSKYGECDITVDGIETVDAFILALDEKQPYDLICLDVMMPKVDGIKALEIIREIEMKRNIAEDKRTKVIMTTALNDSKFVYKAFDIGCEGYAAKPIDPVKFVEVLKRLGLAKE